MCSARRVTIYLGTLFFQTYECCSCFECRLCVCILKSLFFGLQPMSSKIYRFNSKSIEGGCVYMCTRLFFFLPSPTMGLSLCVTVSLLRIRVVETQFRKQENKKRALRKLYNNTRRFGEGIESACLG